MKIINMQRNVNPIDTLRAVTDAQNILDVQNYLASVRMSDAVLEYAIKLCEETRKDKLVSLGVSPRGVTALVKMAKASAVLNERNYVIPEDVQNVFLDVCAHRIVLRPQARVEGVDAVNILSNITSQIKPPSVSER